MSRFDDFVTAVAAQYADGTVSFEAGRLRLNEHGQQRKIIFVRQSGSLQFSTSPGRAAFGAPVADQGTFTKQRFVREEMIEATLRAEDEEALDLMFDRFVNTIFEVAGPNAFEDESAYQWVGEDSRQAGDFEARNPAVKLNFTLRLASRSQPAPYAVVTTITKTATLDPA